MCRSCQGTFVFSNGVENDFKGIHKFPHLSLQLVQAFFVKNNRNIIEKMTS